MNILISSADAKPYYCCMKVCGFSFVRNGTKFDYPFEEALRSILPLCDEIIVAAGNSEDDTAERLRNLDPKVRILETHWDESLRDGGRVFADETNKALAAIPKSYDWAFYIQGDEVVHERYLPVIKGAMEKYQSDQRVDGLLLKYLHFFGSYDYIGLKYSWYRQEIRIIKNRKDIFSYKDAQGFRKLSNQKLNVKKIDAYVYHYGWVRDPEALLAKERLKLNFYRNKDWINEHFADAMKFDYEGIIEPVKEFTGTHPEVMHERIRRKNWPYKPDLTIKYYSLKDLMKRMVGRVTGWYPGEYRNYKIM